METLAQNGVGPGNKDYDALISQRAGIQQQFAASPILKEPPEMVALRDKNFTTRLEGYHLIAGLDDVVKNQNIFKAQDALDEFVKTHPGLSRQDAARIRADGMAHLEKYRPQAEADIKSSQEDTRGIIKGFAAGVDKGPRAGQFRNSRADRPGERAQGWRLLGSTSQLEGALNFAGIPFPALKDDGSGSTIKSNAPHSTSPKAAAPSEPAPTAPTTAAAPAPKVGAMSPQGGPYVSSGGKIYPTDKSGKIVDQPVTPPAAPAPTPAAPAAPAPTGEQPKAEPAAVTTGASEGAAGAHGAFIGALVQIESQGQNVYSKTDPDVTGPNTRSQGYAQINTPTWLDFAAKAGVDTKKYPNAMSAPYDVQIRVASVIPVTRFGPRTRAMLHGQFGQFDDHTTVGELDARYGGSSRAPSDGGSGGTSANGHPQFSREALRANPYLNSALIRSFAEDDGDRYSSISAKAEMTENLAKVGIASPTEEVGAILQYAQSRPDDERAQNLAAKVMGTQLALAAVGGGGVTGPGGGGGMSNRETVEKEIHDWANGPDILHKQAAAVAMEREIEFDKFAKEHPYLHAANAGILKGPAPMIDAGNPQTIPAALQARAGMADFIGKMRGTQAPSLLGESGDGDAFKASLAGPSGADVMRGIGQLKPEVLSSLTSEPAFREGLTAMSHSTDPAKLNAAYGVMDTLARQNPLDFDAKFKDGMKDLTRWQKELSMLPPDQIAKVMQQYNDPNERQAFDKAGKIADEALKTVSADSIVSKFSTGGFWSLGTTAQAPQGEPGRVDAKMAMKADYDDAYKDAFAESSNASTADATAMRKISAKWGMSEINGNRVMPYPPEQAYRNKDGSPMLVNGSFAWMKKQLDADVLKAVGDTGGAKPGQARAVWEAPLTEAQNENLAKASAPRALVSDATTAADVASGKPASYKVVIQDKDGRFSVLSDAASGKDLRVRFDPSMARADVIQGAETTRAANQAAAATVDTEGHGTGPGPVDADLH